MKCDITFGKNRSWLSSVKLGFLGGFMALAVLPLLVIMFALVIVVIPVIIVVGLFGHVMIEPSNKEKE